MNDAVTLETATSRWLLLVHQLPAKPAYFRVKIWRRLQALGAVAIKNAVYALPANEQTQEDFQWLLKEIADGGAEAMICEARLVDGLTDAQVQAMFDAARDEDYAAVANEARDIGAVLEADPAPWAERRGEIAARVLRLRKRCAEIAAIDFFGANGRDAAEGLLAALEARLAQPVAPGDQPAATSGPGASPLVGAVWVTRQGVHVDRIACAWLIRRFIDPEARFKFVPAKGYRPTPGELRFDMFDAEFTHEGDKCTFEVLLARAGIADPALAAIAAIVHDIDLKDEKFARPETTGIAHLIAGIAMASRDDEQRIARGAAVLDDLYAWFRRKAG